MKKSDKENFELTERWVDQHLPYGITISTEDLHVDFMNFLVDRDSKDDPSISAFRSRLSHMDFACSQYEMIENRKGRMVRSKTWFKVEVVEAEEEIPVTTLGKKVKQFLKKRCFMNLRSK